MMRRPAAVGFLLVLTLGPALAAGVAPALAVGADDFDVRVSAIDDAFDPGIVRIEPGQSVVWTVDGRSPHTVTADDGSFDSGKLAPGMTFTRTFDAPGVYAYHCRYDGAPGLGMRGMVVVGDVEIPGPGGGVSPGREPAPTGFGATVRVPADYPTIQEAVDRAEPGGLVLIAPGVYREAVVVTTPYLTIRGEDRNRTILDGTRNTLANGILVIEADGVSVENLTARRFALNGVQWSSVFGYRASYVTAYDNGDNGIFAFDSAYGQIDHSYASGSPEAGFAVGPCDPCNALIADSVAEENTLGFSATNAGGDLAIVNGEWRNNTAGIVLRTLDSEANAPQSDTLVAGNYVHDNNSTAAGTRAAGYAALGIGILVAGGIRDTVTGNLVEDQTAYGIAVLPNLDESLWTTRDNRVRDNIVRRSGRADLALGAPSGGGDCFSGNRASTSAPPRIQTLYGCDGPSLRWIGGGDPAPTASLGLRILEAPDESRPGDGRAHTAPSLQPGMENPLWAPPFPADPSALPQSYRIRDLAAGITSAPGPRVSPAVLVFGIPLATSWWSLVLGLYAYVLPGFLYAAWLTIALWDLIRQESAPVSFRARWMAIVILVPLLGPILYYAFGRSPIPRQLRLMLVVGGALVYALIAALAAVLGG